MEQLDDNERLPLDQVEPQKENRVEAGSSSAEEEKKIAKLKGEAKRAEESYKKCADCRNCQCPQLEAEPIKNHRQLLEFRVRSRDINWRNFVQPLDTSVRSEAAYLDRQADFVGGLRRPVTAENRRELLVCHDMMGNYGEDRHFHSSEKYDDYRFLHWSAVDYFCYFSHEYVTIPPSGWLNAAHRHGVPVLGTFIVEDPAPLDEVLASQESVSQTVTVLTRLCLHFGFEGWLVNVEVTVPPKNMPNLYSFVRELTTATESRVPHGRVFWYDSVTESGALSWQNELNSHNAEFFRRSHATLINYAWSDGHLERSAQQVEREKSQRHRVFMGLDVFGRSRKGGFQSLSSMERVADMGFSAGIFAPGWSFETLSRFGYDIKNSQGDEQVNAAFLARNEAWWARIWPTLATHPYRSLPFYTDFCVGSGRRSFEFGARTTDAERPFFNLSRQSLQPSVPLDGNAVHCFESAFSGGCSLLVTNYERAFRLFVTDLKLTRGVLLLGYAFKISGEAKGVEIQSPRFDVLVRMTPLLEDNHPKEVYLFCGDYNASILSRNCCYISPLVDPLPPTRAHAKLPQYTGSRGEGWQVRYYLAKFDGPVWVADIGVKCQRSAESKAEVRLGAIFLQTLTLEDWSATPSSAKAEFNLRNLLAE